MSVSLNGTSQYLYRVGGVLSSLPSTFAAWVYCTTAGSERTAVSLSSSGDTDPLWRLNLNAVSGTYYYSGQYRASSGSTSASVNSPGSSGASATADAAGGGVWRHVVVTIEVTSGTIASGRATATTYVDGVQVGQATTTGDSDLSISVNRTTIGSLLRTSNSLFWAGDIAEVGIWDRVLTGTEISDLASGDAPSNVTSGLAAYYPLIDGPNDASGNGYNLIPVNSPTWTAHPSGITYPSTDPHPFPTIGSTASSAESGNASSHDISLPSPIDTETNGADELIVLLFVHNAAPTATWPSGWTEVIASGEGSDEALTAHLRYRIADGTEGSTIVVSTSSGRQSAHVAFRVPAGEFDPTTPIAAAAKTVGGPSTTPNPPNCDPGVAADYLWIEAFGADDDDETATYWSADYIGIAQQQSNASSSDSVTAAMAYRQTYASSEDPGNMALAASEEWVAFTFAITPAPETGAATQDIVTAAPSAASEVYQPTAVTPGPVAIETTAPFSGSALYQPAISASASVVAAAPSISSQVYAPTAVMPGTITIATAAPTAGPEVFQPAVTPGEVGIATAAPAAESAIFTPEISSSVSIVAAAPSTASSVFLPSVAPGTVEIQTAAPVSSAQVFEPSASPGTLGIETAGPVLSSQVFEPVVSSGTVTIEASAPSAGSIVYQPTVSAGGAPQEVSTAAPVASAAVYSPAVDSTTEVVAAAPVASSVVYSPSATPGNVEIQTAAPGAGSSVFEPMVSNGEAPLQSIVTTAPVAGTVVLSPTLSASAAISTAAPVSGSQVFQPDIEASSSILTAAPAGDSSVFEPSAAPGVVAVVAAAPASGSQVFSPALDTRVEIVANAVSSAAQVLSPVVSPGEVTVVARLLLSVAQVFEPSLEGGIVHPGISLEWSLESSRFHWKTPGPRLHYTVEPPAPLHWKLSSSPLSYSVGSALDWSLPEADE